MNIFGAIFILVIDITLAVIFGKLAYKKGYPGKAWGIIGFFIPILYLILLLVPTINLPNNSNEESKENKNFEWEKLNNINI